MSEPRVPRIALDAEVDPRVEAADGGKGTSGSSDEIPVEAADVSPRPAPAGLAEAFTQATGEAGSPLGPDAPALDPSNAAGLDAQLGASGGFETWSAGAADPGFGLSPGIDGPSGGMDGLPDPGSRLGGLAGGLEGGFASRPDLGISRDPGSLLGGTGQSDEDLLLAMQRPDSGPDSGGGGGMSEYASGEDSVTFQPVVTRDGWGNTTTETTTNTYGETGPGQGSLLYRGSDYGLVDSTTTVTHSFEPPPDEPEDEEPPADEPPADEPPAAPPTATPPADTTPDDDILTTGDSGPVLQDPGNRPLKAGLDYGQGDPGDSGGTGGSLGGGSGSDPVMDGTKPEPMTIGEAGPVLRDPGLRNPTAGPDFGPGLPGESPAVSARIGGSSMDDGIIIVDTGSRAPATSDLAGLGLAPDAGGAQAPATQQVATALGGAGAVGAVGAVGAAGAAGTTGTTGEGGGAEPGRIGSSSFAMTAETDEAAGTERAATTDVPSASPADGWTSGMVAGPVPGARPDMGMSPGMVTGRDPSLSTDDGGLSAGMATGKDPGAISGSEDEDLEDLEVQRRTVRGETTDATSASAADTGDDFAGRVRGSLPGPFMDAGIVVDTGPATPVGLPDIRPGDPISITGIGHRFSGDAFISADRSSIEGSTWAGGDEIFGSWSTTDQPVAAGSSSTVDVGDATAPTADIAARKDPGMISGSEDEDLEDLEVQRRTVRGGDTAATTGSAGDEGIIVVDSGLQDPRTVGLAGSATDEAVIIRELDRQDPRTVGLAGPGVSSDVGGAQPPVARPVGSALGGVGAVGAAGTTGEGSGGTDGSGIGSSSFAMTADGQSTTTSDAAPVEATEAPPSDATSDGSAARADTGSKESRDAGGALTKDQLGALGISANGVEGMSDKDYARLRYEQAKTGDPLHDGDLRSLYGVDSTASENAQKEHAIVDALTSDDPFVAARGRAVGEIPATPEQQAAYDAAIEKLEATNAATAPLMGIERQRQVMGGALGPATPVEQARWDQANVDYGKAMAGDADAYQRLQQNLAGVTPSPEEMDLFSRAGGLPLPGLERQFQLAGGDVRPQEYLDRLDRLNVDVGNAARGDDGALRRVEGALGMDRGALQPDMLAPGGSVRDIALGTFSTIGLVPGSSGLPPGLGGSVVAGSGAGSGASPGQGIGAAGADGIESSGSSRTSANDALDSFNSGIGVGGGLGIGSSDRTGQGDSDVTPGQVPGEGGGSGGSGAAASPWDDALTALQPPPANEPGFTDPRHSGPDAAAPAAPSTEPSAAGPASTEPAPSSSMSFEDDAPTLVTGGTSEQRPDGTTRTSRDDGSVVQTDAAGDVIYDSRTGEGGHSEAGSDTNSDTGTTDDDTSGGSDAGTTDTPDTTDDTTLTTGEDAPMSARTKAALDFLGYSDTPISRPGTAGPEYGQGDPGAGGDTGGGGAGGAGGSSGDGSHPEPMTTGEGGSVLVDPGSRNPTAGPDYAPGIPGDIPDAPVGTGTHGPVAGGPGMDPTIAAGVDGGSRAAATDSPALADDFSTTIMGGLTSSTTDQGIIIVDTGSIAPVEMSTTHEAPALAVAEMALPPADQAEWKLDPAGREDAPAGGFDLAGQGAAFEVAPAAFEAPQMDQPALEQLDPGVGAQQPPPDASGMGQMDIPLP
jgi:hypothetical protein